MGRESERRELWHQLDGTESDRAHEAFKCYMLLPPAERSVVGAWREWTGNRGPVTPPRAARAASLLNFIVALPALYSVLSCLPAFAKWQQCGSNRG
jgi:hypothetical protein